MLDLALIGSAAALGLAGTPHCTAMCGAACAAAIGRPMACGGTSAAAMAPRSQGAAAAIWSFHLARVASYAAGGALASGSVAALAALSQWSPALRPLWTLLHIAALGLGLWLLWRGRQPDWMSGLGRLPPVRKAAATGWQPIALPLRAAAAGGLWVAWPCGLLQSALLVASMSNTVLGGSAAMAAFAIASSGGLVLAPLAWRRWGASEAAQTFAVRVAGGLLVLASGWALSHGLWAQIVAFCLPS